MASNIPPQNSAAATANCHGEEHNKSESDVISSVPTDWLVGKNLVHYQGFWYPDFIFPGLISVNKYFKPRPKQVLLASYPKSGTTWLKALVFAITNHTNQRSNDATHPLLTKSPHEHIPFLELYTAKNLKNPNSDYYDPILATHIAYSSLPKQILESDCKIVYIVRNPKDVLISFWQFALKCRGREELPPVPMEIAYKMFCDGTSPCGPYWNHVSGYWNASLKFPERVLFLNYDQMKENAFYHVKRLAEFIDHPFSPEQEKQGMIDNVISLCSFETLSNAEVNKNGAHANGAITIQNDVFFRKGKVGDWQNYLSKEMADNLDDIVADKFKGSGLKL